VRVGDDYEGKCMITNGGPMVQMRKSLTIASQHRSPKKLAINSIKVKTFMHSFFISILKRLGPPWRAIKEAKPVLATLQEATGNSKSYW